MKYLSTLFNQTGRNIRQTVGAQLMTLMAVSLSVLIFSFFYLIYTNIVEADTRLSNELRLVIFLDNDINPGQQAELKEKIREFNQVRDIVFVSREEAFNRLEKQLGNDKDVLQDLDPSFLPPSVEVYPSRDLQTLAHLEQFADYLATLPGAAKIQYGHDWLKRFGYFVELLRMIVLLSGGLLIMTTLFMVSYTIRLTLVARQAEIEILRLMGATSAYIRMPLLVEGCIQGILGSAVGMVALYGIFSWVRQRFNGPGLVNLMDLTFFPTSTLAIVFLTSIALCTCGSLLAIRKFLRI